MTKDEIIDWMMNKGFSTGHGESTKDLLDELEWQIAEKERRACARLCAEVGMWDLVHEIEGRGQE